MSRNERHDHHPNARWSIQRIVREVPAVNFHFWQPCNMKCRFCFATFEDVRTTTLPKGHLPKEQAVAVVKALAKSGFEKINFAGGEPTLCPWLPKLVRAAHDSGMVTSMVTNGSRVTRDFLKAIAGALHWAAVSVDSAKDTTNIATGRSLAGRPLGVEHIRHVFGLLRGRGIRLKMNTVVTAANWDEDLAPLVLDLRPERWKVFQALPVAGQNDGSIDDLLVTDEQFNSFVARHQQIESAGIRLVPESNELMTGSYVMVDPAGRFFDDTSGRHTYSRPILEVGVAAALGGVRINADTFERREGRYDWAAPEVVQLSVIR